MIWEFTDEYLTQHEPFYRYIRIRIIRRVVGPLNKVLKPSNIKSKKLYIANVTPDFLKNGWASSNFPSLARAIAAFSWAFSVLMCSGPNDFYKKYSRTAYLINACTKGRC